MVQNAGASSSAPQIEADADATLLRQYIRHGSQAAFAALVRRYGRLVHTTCLREVDDMQLAEDSTQVVFLLLARKAPSLLRMESLAGWLFRTARFTARNALRRERRRKVQEQKVIEDMTQAHLNGPPLPSWSLLEPLLNAALAALRPHEQAVILLRYLEGASWHETAARLGLAEDAAQKRGARAVEKMRRFVNRQGHMLSFAALMALLSEEAARSAPLPAAVVTKMVSAIAKEGLPSPNVTSLYQGVMHAMKMTKTAAALSSLFLAGTVGSILWAQIAPKPETPQQLLARTRDHYQKLSSFSMRIEHQDAADIDPGGYTQKLQWRRGGRFTIRGTAPENPKITDFIANGRRVTYMYMVDDIHFNTPLTVAQNSMPAWEMFGGEILGWLQETPASRSWFSPAGMPLFWTYGPRTVWHGMKVRELQGHISNQGHRSTVSLFLDANALRLVGHEGERNDGKPGPNYVLYLDQKENPPLSATLGNAP